MASDPITSWQIGGETMETVLHFIVAHRVKGFGIVNKAEIDVFLELSCFFDGPGDFGAQENKVSHCFHCFPTYLP